MYPLNINNIKAELFIPKKMQTPFLHFFNFNLAFFNHSPNSFATQKKIVYYVVKDTN